MRVILSAQARADPNEIGEWIALDDPLRAFDFIDEIEERCFALDQYPERFPVAFTKAGQSIRKLSHANYLVFYTVAGPKVNVLRVVHGARDWSKLFDA